MRIPSDRQWNQTNEGDTFGVLHRTRNIDLSVPGKAILSRKSVAVMNPAEPTANDLEYTLALPYYNGKYIAVHTAGVRTFDLEGSAIGSTGSDPTPSIYGDGIIFNNLLHVSTTDNLSSWNGSAWTNSLESNTASVPHPMEIFDSLPTYKLAIANGNTVKLLDTSYNNSSTVLTLPNQYVITSLAYRNAYLYVATRNKYGGDAGIFIWDGDTNNANYFVPVSGNWVYSVKPYLDSVCAITSSGELIYVNGTSAQRLSALPVFYSNLIWQNDTNSDVPRVFNRGMETDGEKIYINVDAKIDNNLQNDYMPEFDSGIWVFEPGTGLYHYASSTRDVYVSDDGLSVTDSVITTSAAHNLKTGDSIIFSSVSGLSGVDITYTYYAIVESATTLKIANSRRGALNGANLTITGTADSSDILIYSPNIDYHQYGRVTSGAITKLTASDSFFKNWHTPIIWGAGVQAVAVSAQSYAINILTDSFNVGFIETQRIYSDNITQSWKKLYTFLDGLKLDDEKVIVKFRTQYEEGYPTKAYLGAWLTDNTINSSVTYEDWSYVKVGDEAMILDGSGRGYSAHVTAVSRSSTVTSVTLDESIGTEGGVCRVSFTNYKKAGTYTNQKEANGYVEASPADESKSDWVQFKIEMRGFNTAVDHLELVHSVDKSAV